MTEIILEEYIGHQEIQVAVINGKPLGALNLFLKDYFMITKLGYTKKQRQNM